MTFSLDKKAIMSTETIKDLRRFLTGGDLLENPESDPTIITESTPVALPVAAIKTLLGVIQRTQSETMMGLQMELKHASEEMIQFINDEKNYVLLGGRSHIAMASGCELFMKYITRCFLDQPNFKTCIAQILERGRRFSNISLAARDNIAKAGQAFIRPNQTVLTHGWSRAVSSLLLKAAQHTDFEIVILEGRPDASGVKSAKVYEAAGIPTTVVLDSAMAYIMERVDLVIVGAEGVVENGGIVNKIGTYALALAAKELGKPFYVAAESFKFARLFPLNQSDLPELGSFMRDKLTFVDTAILRATLGESQSLHETESKNLTTVPGLIALPDQVRVENPPCDYTPAKYITLLFTDLGVLTPSAVSDELIRLYQ